MQDAYCLRCAPQVHGAVRDVLGFAGQVITIELGAVVDNPVIVPDGEVMTTGISTVSRSRSPPTCSR